jgi:hypothetical protein
VMSSNMVRCTSLSPPAPSSTRAPPMASTWVRTSWHELGRVARGGGKAFWQCAHLIKEDDGGLLAAGQLEDLPHHSCPLQPHPHTNRPLWTGGRAQYAAQRKPNKASRHTSPTYFCTNSLPMTRMKAASVRLATARAQSCRGRPRAENHSAVRAEQHGQGVGANATVFPVPGGP